MSYERELHQGLHTVTTRSHWWKRWTRQEYTPQRAAPVSLPYPTFPTALDFDVDHFSVPNHLSDALERPVLYPTRYHSSLRSPGSTLVDVEHDAFLSTSKAQESPPQLPPKRHSKVVRYLHYTLLTVYRRLFTVVFLANLIPLLVLVLRHLHSTNTIDIDTLATSASTNFLLAILIRQEFIINAIFRTAWVVPWNLPLRIRRWAARCYCYGGIHSGASIAGSIWWVLFSTLLTIRFVKEQEYTLPIVIITLTILSLLVVVAILAYPALRKRYHNTFECTHRFLGWASILLFWVQLLLLVFYDATSLGKSSSTFLVRLLHIPTFYNLTFMTAMLIYPWLWLRTWAFTSEVLSSHALRLRFSKPVHKFSCLSISTSPLSEWHPFATFPSLDPFTNAPSTSENSLIISSAGDWTRNIIIRAQYHEDKEHVYPTDAPPPQMRFWIKGSPRPGVLSLAVLFRRVLILTTGSGIGPSLSTLLNRPDLQVARLIWSTRSPFLTYGSSLYQTILSTDPEALIIDTDAVGRPDLVQVTWRMYKEMQAEAVFVLSNEVVTKRVVGALETRGVLAFGPIWDS